MKLTFLQAARKLGYMIHIIGVRVVVSANGRPLELRVRRWIGLQPLEHVVNHLVEALARDKPGDAIAPQELNTFAQRVVNTSAFTVGHLGHTIDLALFGD